MKISKMLRTPGIWSVAIVLSTAGIQAPVMAGMIDTPELAIQAELQLQRDEVRAFMARDDVREALVGYGVSAADVDARINNLSEIELLQIQNQLAQLPAGGNGVVGAVLGIILILILLDILGVTNVFPRI